MLFSAGVAVLGVILTKLTLPEPSGKTLEALGGEDGTAAGAGPANHSGHPVESSPQS